MVWRWPIVDRTARSIVSIKSFTGTLPVYKQRDLQLLLYRNDIAIVPSKAGRSSGLYVNSEQSTYTEGLRNCEQSRYTRRLRNWAVCRKEENKLCICIMIRLQCGFLYESGTVPAAPGLRAQINDAAIMGSPTKSSWKLWKSNSSSINLFSSILRILVDKMQ